MKQSTRGTPASDPGAERRSEVPQPSGVHEDWLLDEALQETFPASDPIAPAGDAHRDRTGRADPRTTG